MPTGLPRGKKLRWPLHSITRIKTRDRKTGRYLSKTRDWVWSTHLSFQYLSGFLWVGRQPGLQVSSEQSDCIVRPCVKIKTIEFEAQDPYG